MPSCELQRRFEYCVAGRPYPGLRETALSVGVKQRAQRAELAYERTRELHRRVAAIARAEQEREQLRVRERVWSALQQFFPRTFGAGPVANAHYFQF